jgi:hypothetical protein
MRFSSRAALNFGWETFKKRLWFFIGATFLILLASALSEGLSSRIDAAITGSAENPSILGAVVSLAFGTLISMGATAFYLAAHDHPDTVELSTLWHPRAFWKYLGASILLALAVGVGLLLLCRPWMPSSGPGIQVEAVSYSAGTSGRCSTLAASAALRGLR